jgi:alpha-tubulin suppressor-like RCC1 family protein
MSALMPDAPGSRNIGGGEFCSVSFHWSNNLSSKAVAMPARIKTAEWAFPSWRIILASALLAVSVLGGIAWTSRAAQAVTEGTPWISAGSYLSCAVEAGTGYCWGLDDQGQLGNGAAGSNSDVPVAVDISGVLAGKTLTQISAGEEYACALDSDGAPYCWGWNVTGDLGDGSTAGSNVPVAVETSGVLAGKTLTQISAGDGETCALDTVGTAYCWGLNEYGNLGNGTTTNSDVPVAVDTSGALAGKTLTHISAGGEHVCALDTSGVAYCWGENESGDLGDGATADSDVPVAIDTSGVLNGKTLTQISADEEHTCALDTSGSAYCWGSNGGDLGNGTTAGSDVPVAVDTSGALAGKTLTEISSGGNYTCGVDSTGAAYCWGDDDSGQLGNGNTSASDVPVAVNTSGALDGRIVSQISAGYGSHVCVLDNSGEAYCWGYNYYGQLGNDTTNAMSIVPVAVGPSPPTNVTAVSGAAVSVSWVSPSLTGGTVSGYTATASPGSETCATDGAMSCAITGLTDGTSYDITVVAHAANGNSAPSGPTEITPTSIPGVPTAVAAVAGDASATVSWTPPASSGGSPVTSYTVSASDVTDPARGGQTTTGMSSPLTLSGLTNGDTYTFTVTATNAIGSSAPSSPSSTVTIGEQPEITSRASVSIGMRAPFRFTVTTSGKPVPTITETGKLPAGVTFVDNGDETASLTGAAENGTAGSYPITLTASNGVGKPATQPFTFIVTSKRSAPTITSAAADTVPFGVSFSFTVTTTGYPPPNLTRKDPLPAGVKFTDNRDGTATISGVPTKKTVGVHLLTLIAKNRAGKVTQAFSLIITKVPSSTEFRPIRP